MRTSVCVRDSIDRAIGQRRQLHFISDASPNTTTSTNHQQKHQL